MARNDIKGQKRKDTNKLKDYRKKYKRHYGIDFDRTYVVHHIDEDRENNDINNLLLLPSALHSKYHTYKSMFLMCLEHSNGFCLDLTYKGSSVRGWQFRELDNLRVVFNELQEWIERKYLADNGYRGYKGFEIGV